MSNEFTPVEVVSTVPAPLGSTSVSTGSASTSTVSTSTTVGTSSGTSITDQTSIMAPQGSVAALQGSSSIQVAAPQGSVAALQGSSSIQVAAPQGSVAALQGSALTQMAATQGSVPVDSCGEIDDANISILAQRIFYTSTFCQGQHPTYSSPETLRRSIIEGDTNFGTFDNVDGSESQVQEFLDLFKGYN